MMMVKINSFRSGLALPPLNFGKLHTFPEVEAVDDCCWSCLDPLAAPAAPGPSGMDGRDW